MLVRYELCSIPGRLSVIERRNGFSPLMLRSNRYPAWIRYPEDGDRLPDREHAKGGAALRMGTVYPGHVFGQGSQKASSGTPTPPSRLLPTATYFRLDSSPVYCQGQLYS